MNQILRNSEKMLHNKINYSIFSGQKKKDEH